MAVRVVPLSPSLEEAWDSLARLSDDAWFWQTVAWIRWATVIAGPAFVSAQSFVLLDPAGNIAAVCPVNIEAREGERVFSFLGGPLPAPAFANHLSAAERSHAGAVYVDTVEAIARREQVDHGSIKMPFTRELRPADSLVNPWLRFGYFDLPHVTQVIDLRHEEQTLWSAMRKGHRADVKRAAQRAAVRIWDGETLTRTKREEYQALHARDAGRVTRSTTTFEMMEEWIRSGHAVLAEAHAADRPIAFAVIIHYKAGAFYASGCREPEVTDIPGSHLLQWEVMRWLKRRGCHRYDIGMQFNGPQWFYVPSAKEVSIAAFKRGFGGETVPLVTAERFYSTDSMRRVFAARLDAYIEAVSASPVGG